MRSVSVRLCEEFAETDTPREWAELRIAGGPARHRVERPRRQLRAPRPADRCGRRRRGRAGAVHGDVLDRLRRRRPRPRRARGRAVVDVPRRPGPSSTACGSAGSCPEIPAGAAPDDQRPCNSFVLAGPDGTVHRYRKIHPFTFGGEERHFRAGDEFVTVDIEGLRISLFVCYDLRFADEFWQLAADTDVYLVPGQLAGQAAPALAGAAAGPGDREPGVRRRRQPRRRGRRPRLLRRQPHRRPARRAAGDGRADREHPPRRRLGRPRGLDPRPLPVPPGPPVAGVSVRIVVARATDIRTETGEGRR